MQREAAGQSHSAPSCSLSSRGVATPSREPVWLPAALQPGAFAFALLFAVESVSRATIVSVVPIQAYDLLKNEQKVSIFYFVVGSIAMCATLCAPILFQRLPRRYVYTLGALFLTCAMALSRPTRSSVRPPGCSSESGRGHRLDRPQPLHHGVHPEARAGRSKSLRLTLGTFAWTLGPSFGVWL